MSESKVAVESHDSQEAELSQIFKLLKEPGNLLVDRNWVKIDLLDYRMVDVYQSPDGRFEVRKVCQLTADGSKTIEFKYSTVLERISKAPRTSVKLSVLEQIIPFLKSAEDRKAAIKLHGELLDQYVSECKYKFAGFS